MLAVAAAGRVSSSLDDDEPVVCEEGGESIVGVAVRGGAWLMDDGIHSTLREACG